MIDTLDAIPGEAVLVADVCVIGAGAAGITLVREFLGTRTEVIVLESGTLALDDATESLNVGEVVGLPFLGLTQGRRRGFGGTTAAWGGQCCEIDRSDFLARSWVPASGWPIGYDDVAPYYRRAEAVFGVSRERYDETNWRRFGLDPVAFDPMRLNTVFSVFSPRPRIGQVYRKSIASAANVRVLLGATAVNIRTDETASRATAVDVRGIDGKRLMVRAKAFVICTGTIESARLLLASRDVARDGLGNDRDLVGRYFQDHPTADTASLVPADVRSFQDRYGVFYRGRTWYWPKIALSYETQRAARALNASAFVTFEYESSAIEVLREMVRTTRTGGRFALSPARIARLVRDLPSVAQAGFRRYVLGRSPLAAPAKMELTCTIEQLPNRESRITLASAVDRFGMPLARIDWRLTDAERHTFRILTRNVSREFERLGLARVIDKPWLSGDDDAAWKIWDNYHQTGTTRMSRDPAHGVVDTNCQVHGIAGLFVAGAPTFPTSGYGNPVLTIAALSIRLADHLKSQRRAEDVAILARPERATHGVNSATA